MRRLAARLLARLHHSFASRGHKARNSANRPAANRRAASRRAASRELRHLLCEPLEARRQLASITLTLDDDGLLSLVDSAAALDVANDMVGVTEDDTNVTIDLGPGNSFASGSTELTAGGIPVTYMVDGAGNKTSATIAKSSIQSVQVVLDNTVDGGQDIVTWSLAEDSSLTSVTVPLTTITANVLSFTTNVSLAGDLSIMVDNLDVNGFIAGPYNLQVTGTGASTGTSVIATFHGPLGTSAVPLGDGAGVSLALSGTDGSFSFEADVFLANGATAAADTSVVLNGNYFSADGDTTLSGNVSLAGDNFQSAGAVTLGTDAETELRIVSESAMVIQSVSGGVTIESATILESDLELRAAGDGIVVNGTIDGLALGAQSIQFSSPGTTALNQALGGGEPLRSIFTDSPGTTLLGASVTVNGGNVTFTNPVALAADVMLIGRAGSRIFFQETLDGADIGEDSLTLDCPDGSYFQKSVGALEPVGDGTGPALTFIAGLVDFDSTVATDSGVVQENAAGLVTFRGAVSLGAGDAESDFQGNVALVGITFSSAGNVTFGNAPSDTLRVIGPLTTITHTTPAAGVDITLNAATTLAADLVINAGAGAIVLNGTVNDELAGTHRLTLTSGGDTVINAPIGGLAAPRSLLANGDAPGITQIAATIQLGAGGATFFDTVKLVGDISIIVTGGGGASFFGRVLGGASLTLDVDGATNFSEDVGRADPSDPTDPSDAIGDGSGEALVILSSGLTSFFRDLVTNSGIRQSPVAGGIIFEQAVVIGEGDAADGVSSIFEADVELRGADFQAGRSVQFGRLSGGDTVAIAGSAVAIRTVANDGNIVFAATVDGPATLTLAADGAGNIDFRAPLGSLAPPSSLTVEGSNTVTFFADATVQNLVDVTATETIRVERLLRSLAGTVRLETTGGGNIELESLDASVAVDLRAGNAVQLTMPDRLPTDITAPLLRITANSGIGSAFPLKTVAEKLAAANTTTGDIRILNTGLSTASILNIDAVLDLDGMALNGISNMAPGGAIAIRNPTRIEVLQPINAAGAINLTALDTPENNSIRVAAAIGSSTSTVSISSGDNIELIAGQAITAAGKITLAGDTASTDGSEIKLAGNVISTATTAESIAIVTGGGADSVRISGQLQTNATVADAISISTGNGNDQLFIDSNGGTAADGGTVTGMLGRLTYRAGTGSDSLTLDNSGISAAQNVTIAPLANVAGLFAGAIGAAVGNNYFAVGRNLSYDNVEDVTLSTGTGDDTVDATMFFNSSTARRTNFVFRESANADSDKLLLNYTLFPEASSPYVLATTANGRALAGTDSSGRRFGSLRWDDIETVQAVVPRIVDTIPANALFLAGRINFNDIARYTGTTTLVALNVNGIDFESHAGIQALIAYGRSGNDQIVVDNPSINIPAEFRGEQGADFLSGGAAADRLFGDLETDAAGGRDTIFGQGGDDTLFGFAANDVIHGNAGDDLIDGGNGNDVLYGNEGQDIVRGGAGNDVLYGVSGNDVLLGEAGNDKLYAGTNRSLLIGGAGADYLYGLNGDILVGGQVANASNNTHLLDAVNTWATAASTSPFTTTSRDLIRVKLGAHTDTERDYLTGSATTSVLDWFFASATDVFTRRAATDLFN